MHIKTRNKDEVAFIINDTLIQDISTHVRNNKKNSGIWRDFASSEEDIRE